MNPVHPWNSTLNREGNKKNMRFFKIVIRKNKKRGNFRKSKYLKLKIYFHKMF